MSDDQSDVIAFLSSPLTFAGAGPVKVVETHGSLVFLCGDQALKLKRAVVYDYMDLGTPAKRHALLLREIALNRPAAPQIYRDVVPVTRDPAGRLAIDGDGAPVDWVLRMKRFPAADELVTIAERGGIDDALATAIGHGLATYHAAAPARPCGGARLIADILEEIDRVLGGFPDASTRGAQPEWDAAVRAALAIAAPLLDTRGRSGAVCRAHGDLHLRNLVLLDGKPVPFDALEFDETLGTCDLLYDLAFLLMDLCHRDLRRAACRVLDAWLLDFDGRHDEGLALLPLFLSVRAAIRAMVLLQTDSARHQDPRTDAEAALYLRQAIAFLAPAPAALVAIGGCSGSGKSSLARALAPHLGTAPGAVWLSSDVTRKAAARSDAPLPAAAYAATARAQVYDRMRQRARTILGAGHSVILDATFLDPHDRAAARDVADRLALPFTGLWLDAPPDLLRRRVSARHGDPSDADVAVLDRQLATCDVPADWTHLDASCDLPTLIDRARNAIRPRPR